MPLPCSRRAEGLAAPSASTWTGGALLLSSTDAPVERSLCFCALGGWVPGSVRSAAGRQQRTGGPSWAPTPRTPMTAHRKPRRPRRHLPCPYSAPQTASASADISASVNVLAIALSRPGLAAGRLSSARACRGIPHRDAGANPRIRPASGLRVLQPVGEADLFPYRRTRAPVHPGTTRQVTEGMGLTAAVIPVEAIR